MNPQVKLHYLNLQKQLTASVKPAMILQKEYGNRGADTISTCLEAAKPGKSRERRSRRNVLLSQAVCWGAVEQAAHSHQTVEALLFHGWMIYGAVGCKNRCSFFAGRA